MSALIAFSVVGMCSAFPQQATSYVRPLPLTSYQTSTSGLLVSPVFPHDPTPVYNPVPASPLTIGYTPGDTSEVQEAKRNFFTLYNAHGILSALAPDDDNHEESTSYAHPLSHSNFKTSSFGPAGSPVTQDRIREVSSVRKAAFDTFINQSNNRREFAISAALNNPIFPFEQSSLDNGDPFSSQTQQYGLYTPEGLATITEFFRLYNQHAALVNAVNAIDN